MSGRNTDFPCNAVAAVTTVAAPQDSQRDRNQSGPYFVYQEVSFHIRSFMFSRCAITQLEDKLTQRSFPRLTVPWPRKPINCRSFSAIRMAIADWSKFRRHRRKRQVHSPLNDFGRWFAHRAKANCRATNNKQPLLLPRRSRKRWPSPRVFPPAQILSPPAVFAPCRLARHPSRDTQMKPDSGPLFSPCCRPAKTASLVWRRVRNHGHPVLNTARDDFGEGRIGFG